MSLEGTYWNGFVSAPHNAYVTFKDGCIHLKLEGAQDSLIYHHFTVSQRIANVPRHIRFPDGGQVDVADNDAVDRLFPSDDLTHKLENKIQTVLLATVFVFIVGFLIYSVGLPRVADFVAPKIPLTLLDSISEPTVKLLDERVFSESKTPQATQRQLMEDFNSLLLAETQFNYQLLFRDGGTMGANALALPNGTIIITDQLLELADVNEEIYAVLAHEVGHIEHRHTVKMLLRQAGVVALFAGLFGDVAFVTDTILAAPLLLTQMAMSRKMETEADDYSHMVMVHYKVSPVHFANMIEKLASANTVNEGQWSTLLSSHPDTKERAEKARKMAEDVNL